MNIIYFDLNSCIICVLLLITLTVHRSIRLNQNRVFIRLLLSVLAAGFCSMLSSMGQNEVLLGKEGFLADGSVLYFTTFAYMLFHIACPLLFFQYVRVVLNIGNSRVSDSILAYAPIVAAYTVLAITPINDAIFYFRAGRYYRGGCRFQ